MNYFFISLLTVGVLIMIYNFYQAIISYGEMQRLKGQEESSEEWLKFTQDLVKMIREGKVK